MPAGGPEGDFAIVGEARALFDEAFPQNIRAANGRGPAFGRGGLAEEKKFAGRRGGLCHFVMQENGNLGRGFVGGENPWGVIDAIGVG